MRKSMKITEYMKENLLYLDGGTGTLLQAAGLSSGELPERWNLTRPDVIRKIHRDYFDSGSNLVCTNTFGANLLKFSPEELEKIICAAVNNAKIAAGESLSPSPKWVALDIGPSGRMLKPLGDLEFEDAVELFAATIRLGVKYGVDLIYIETMSDSYETKAALLAAKENSSLPVFVSNAYGEDGKLLTGATPTAMVAMLEGLGADAIGVNCSLGPNALLPILSQYAEYSSLPIIFKPNAGLPEIENGSTVYRLSPEDFALQMKSAVSLGASVLGGCCGTTPEYISSLVEMTCRLEKPTVSEKEHTIASSYADSVIFDRRPVLIGERINPTGKPKIKEALRSSDLDYILREGIGQEDAGAQILDVNVGLPEIDEGKMLPLAVRRLQEVTSLPLQIDSADSSAMEAALRIYNGKPLINSVSGKAESMAKILPLAAKYGGVLIALTLDENGIPTCAEDRLKIARKILKEAKKYGIKKKNIIFDPLAMAVSADKNAPGETLRAVKLISEKLGCKCSLGVSNVSFGLPGREILNSTFFTLALSNGLSAAIMNPYSEPMMNAYRSYLALCGLDEDFSAYLSAFKSKEDNKSDDVSCLKSAIIKGMRDRAGTIARDLLNNLSPIEIVDSEIIPALNLVGEGYERREIYLPGLLMSAEAAGAAFEVIREKSASSAEKNSTKILLATVKGDIHDIGKNILKLILENYGFTVIDLGKDVPANEILREAEKNSVDIVGLSALMTTTVPAMEETVRLLKERLPSVRVMVGGAVLTQEYALKMGADFYGKDAIEAVKYAQNVNKS